MNRPNIILTGFMGTGKTTVGRLLASRLGYRFVDTDALIEERAGRSIPEIFQQDGEAAFRGMESALARELGSAEGLVVATGGGLMLDPANAAALLAQGRAYCLVAALEDVLARVQSDAGIERPLLSGPAPQERILELMAERAPGYARFTQVPTSGKTASEVTESILDLITKSL